MKTMPTKIAALAAAVVAIAAVSLISVRAPLQLDAQHADAETKGDSLGCDGHGTAPSCAGCFEHQCILVCVGGTACDVFPEVPGQYGGGCVPVGACVSGGSGGSGAFPTTLPTSDAEQATVDAYFSDVVREPYLACLTKRGIGRDLSLSFVYTYERAKDEWRYPDAGGALRVEKTAVDEKTVAAALECMETAVAGTSFAVGKRFANEATYEVHWTWRW